MMPAEACYTVTNTGEQQAEIAGNINIPTPAVVAGVGLITVAALMSMKNRRKERQETNR